MNYLFAPPEQPHLPIMGDTRAFPVRRIFCIGRNYSEHAREMGVAVERNDPLFFMKPADAIVTNGQAVPWPGATSSLHHEVEMVVALKDGGKDMSSAQAEQCIFGHAVGLDLTRRDLQAQAKQKGAPWDTAKGLDHGAPISAICPLATKAPDAATTLSLHINGERRQHAVLGDMIWSVPETIAILSTLFELKAGDLLFTGTPAGVANLAPGDMFHAELGGIATLDGQIGAAAG